MVVYRITEMVMEMARIGDDGDLLANCYISRGVRVLVEGFTEGDRGRRHLGETVVAEWLIVIRRRYERMGMDCEMGMGCDGDFASPSLTSLCHHQTFIHNRTVYPVAIHNLLASFVIYRRNL